MSSPKGTAGALVRVTEFHIGEGPERLKVGIADDGTFLIVLAPSKRKRDEVISLERTNAVAILRHLARLLETGNEDITPAARPGRSKTR